MMDKIYLVLSINTINYLLLSTLIILIIYINLPLHNFEYFVIWFILSLGITKLGNKYFN
jgi:hypothetical protein